MLQKIKKQDGLSLLEVIASITIISILLLSFFTLFTRTAQTTNTANNMIDATYFAQKEMEYLYNLTTKELQGEREQAITEQLASIGFELDVHTSNEFQKSGNQSDHPPDIYIYKLIVHDSFYSNDGIDDLIRFTLLVCDKSSDCSNNAAKAKMTSIYEWRVKDENSQ